MNSLAAENDQVLPGDVLSPEEIVGQLSLEQVEANMFRDRGTSGSGSRLYGGQVAAQALQAAGYTVTGARPHSLHAYFLRQGDAGSSVFFQVDALHDGRTFHRRRVTAIQQGQPILCLDTSFTSDASEATDFSAPRSVPSPEECAAFPPDLRTGRAQAWRLFDIRCVPGGGEPRVASGDLWFRFRAPAAAGILPEVMLTYLSDLSLAATALRPTERHPAGRRDVGGLTSLDHSLWFHNPADLSDWLLYEKTTWATGPLRGLVTGQIFNQGGTLVASVAQEALLHGKNK